MPLFHIHGQDDVGPAYVIASSYGKAVAVWKKAIMDEDGSVEEPGNPDSVTLLGEDDDIVVERDSDG